MKRYALPAVLSVSILALSGCGSSPASSDASDAPADEIVLTHPTEAGLSITFDAQPETLVMDCYAYSSLHEYGVEPVALFGYDCDNPFVMGDIDISDIERVGQDGEIDVEKLAALRPDAILGHGGADGWSWFDDDVNAQLTRVAPFVPVQYTDSVDAGIAAVRDLAAFFGADVEADHIVAADADYEAAKKTFSAAVAESDLGIMFTSPAKEMLYTAVGFAPSDLLAELGATVIGPDKPESGNPWGQVAWEEASTHPADIILVEGYSDDFAFTAELWQSLPAVSADQLGPWGSKGAMTSSAYAAWLNAMAELVTASEDVA